MLRSTLLLLIITSIYAYDKQEGCCSYGDPCWPTNADVEELIVNLGGNSINRTLYYTDGPYISPIPWGSDQPFFGAGMHLNAVYVQPEQDRLKPCTEWNEYCKISTRFQPRDETTPAFVVFPTTAGQVQEAVKFAIKHNLCISVAGTGHDMMNRHSNHESLFIRTPLLKSIDVDLSTENAFQHPNVKVGAGSTFSEIQHSLSNHGKMIATGWCDTVGIIGWSTGGGRGPSCSLNGLGVDQILEAQIVTADGKLTTANANENEDLYWAIRGGGAAPWGVFTSITVRIHDFPSSGVNWINYKYRGETCRHPNYLDTIIENYSKVILMISKKWGGELMIKYDSDKCSEWTALVRYYYYGKPSDVDFLETKFKFENLAPRVSLDGRHIYKAFDIAPYCKWFEPDHLSSSVNTTTGVLVSRETVEDGTMTQVLKKLATKSRKGRWTFQNDLTGNIGSPQQINTALSDGMRSGLVNLVFWGDGGDMSIELEQLGNNSYYAESTYNMHNWQERYWGPQNYKRLLSIKQKYDPNNIFWCRHCVGSENARINQSLRKGK